MTLVSLLYSLTSITRKNKKILCVTLSPGDINIELIREINCLNTLIGLILARLNFAISRIFAIFAKLELAKTCEIVDSRN